MPGNDPNKLNPVPDEAGVRKGLEKNPHIDTFVKLGTQLLERTNRPNVITVEQFAPYIALYKIDMDKFENDEQYQLTIKKLYQQFRVNLSINLHEPTFVVRSMEDQTVEYHLDRVFTRIKSDVLAPGHSAKEKLPQIGPRTDKNRREDLIVGAIVTDVAKANESPEQVQEFWRMRQESALVTKRFVEQNLSPEKREELIKENDHSLQSPSPDNSSTIVFDDD